VNIPLTRPWTTIRERELLDEVLDSGWLTHGSHVTDFEHAIAARIGVHHAVACTSCTTALHIALLLHHIGPEDEVIVPSYTWIATPNAVRMVGATPVFVDIDLATFNITAPAIERAITARTKAVILVHQFGLPADIESIDALARRHGVVVIEDAACAIGSAYAGRAVGAHGHLTCFSFHPRKVLTTGEGGMLVTNDATLATRARRLINHGASVSDLAKHAAGSVEALLAEEFSELGFNYRMTNLQGALGLGQLEKLDEALERRATRALRYSAALEKHPSVVVPSVPDGRAPNWQSYALRIVSEEPGARDRVATRLLDAKIACRPAYMACHVQPLYRTIHPDLRLPSTEQALREVLILPLYPQMTDEEQDHVLFELERALRALPH
jgi:perosamine synthetase